MSYFLKELRLWIEQRKTAGISEESIKKLTGKNFEMFLTGASKNQEIRMEYEKQIHQNRQKGK